MEDKIKTLFDYIKNLCEADLDRIISFVLGIVSIDQQSQEKPDCPYCRGKHVVKFGHRNGKQRFLCRGCSRTFMRSTNTLMANSHYTQSVWIDFIQDTLSDMPGGMPSLRRSCLPSQTIHESSQFIVPSVFILCYNVCKNNSTLQSTAW